MFLLRHCVFIAAVIFSTHVLGVYISNLSEGCLYCICQAATGCNSSTCIRGYCGPFHMSRIYWVDAGKIVLPEDDVIREGAYEDCANNYDCAKGIVKGYLNKFGKDCNGDLVTNCEDYAMIHFNGGYGCEKSLEGTGYYQRYLACHQEDESCVGNE